ncbi:Zinc finger, C2H2 type [Dirofilaria immitis]|nr:Zinc finger, C2H2 type [Dirofilaria immitis]
MEVENPIGSMDNEQYRQMNGDERSDYLDDDDKSPCKKERTSRSKSRSTSSKRRRRRRQHSSSSSTHTASTKSHSRSRSKSRTKSHSRSRSPRHVSSRSRSRSRRKSSKKKARRASRSYSHSHSPMRRRKTSRSRSPRRRPTRSSSSSSRDTYGSFKAMSPASLFIIIIVIVLRHTHPNDLMMMQRLYKQTHCPARPVYEYPCRKCDRDFETIRELCEHEIRAHGACFPCPHCEKQASSVQKLCEHMKRRHSDYRLLCDFCKDDFGGKINGAKDSNWEEFRDHIYKECLKEKIYLADRQRGRSAGIAQRGRGRCPHGPPVKCKNFPNCPGEKCYYFHGYCRYDKLCVKKNVHLTTRIVHVFACLALETTRDAFDEMQFTQICYHFDG